MPVDPKTQSSKSFPFAEYNSVSDVAVVYNPPPGNMPVNADGSVSAVVSIDGVRTALPLRTNEIAFKPFGACVNNITVNQTTGLSTEANACYGMKGEAEAHFDAMCLVWVNRTANVLTNCSALMGVTETATTTGTNAQKSQVIINGTTYATVAPAGSILGFRQAKVNGATTWSTPAGVSSVAYVKTDWEPLSSIPRADGGKLPLWMYRAQHDAAVDGNHSFISAAGYSQLQSPSQANRGRILQMFFFGNVAVTNPAFNGSFSTTALEVFPMFRFRNPGLSGIFFGDSTTQGDSLVSAVLTNWMWRGCMDASSMNKPVSFINMGCSGKTTAEYWLRTQEIFNAGFTFDFAVGCPFSVNNVYTTATLDRQFEAGRALAFEMLAFFKSKGVRYVFWSPLLPSNSLTPLQDSYRKAFNQFLKGLSYSTMLDFSGLGNNASPEQWKTEYLYSLDGLGIHENENAMDTLMSAELTRKLVAIA